MALMGDRFEGSFEKHKVEVVRTNIDKQVVVSVDGMEIARESVALPHKWDQVKEFECDGKKHTLAAHSVVKKLLGIVPIDNEYSIEIDGNPVALTKVS
jgi:hypothetical protein